MEPLNELEGSYKYSGSKTAIKEMRVAMLI